LYSDALKLLSKKGYSKPPSMTPGEFSQYVVSEGGEAYLPFRRITDKYLSIRFGERNTRQDVDELRQMVLEFRKNCR
jgi:hypothetical protein